jgi:osmotically-inducible protein OsmY
MTIRKTSISLLVVAALSLATPCAMNAQDRGAGTDNTRVNKRDRKSSAVTADQQKETDTDREISANIRRALMDNKDLSIYAHNVKIITRNGIVTLKGPVRSAEEKKQVETKATEIAGAGKVKSMISVKPKS